MIRPRDLYEYRNIVIPVIGENCFLYRNEIKEQPLQDFIVEELTKGVSIGEELLQRMKQSGYYGLTLLRKHCFNNDESEFKLEYRHVIEDNINNIHLNSVVKKFLQTYSNDFPVIVTTSSFRLIENELPLYKSSSFPALDGNQAKIDSEGKIVYHIFGLEDPGANWVAGEDDLLHFVHELHREGATDLKKFINADNKKKALFVIGSNLPDWLFRFFLYPMTVASNNKVGYFLSSEDSIEDSFRNFLDDIHYRYDINASFEKVLKDAIDLYPSSGGNKIESRRVAHQKDYDIFISYASENRSVAERMKDILEKSYQLRVWLDQSQIVDGDYEKRIIYGISNSAYFMPLVTKEYIGKHKRIFDEYKSIEDIVNDKKLEFVQMETLIAEKLQKEDRRITYSIPIVIPSTICGDKTLDFSMIENNCTDDGTLPSNLFRRQNMFYYENVFNGQKDWSIYKTKEL